jgi:VCBS repeat-containing protein
MKIATKFRLTPRLTATLIAFVLFFLSSMTVKADTFTVTNLSDSGSGSLREAIMFANNNPGPDRITFNVAGTINVSSQLPALNDTTGPTTIDGSTAPGFSSAPVVKLLGLNITLGGLEITSAGNIVQALQISNFFSAIKISGLQASGNVLVGNYIGVFGIIDSNFTAIEIADAPNNRIGTNSDGLDDASERNVIFATRSSVIWIHGSTATENIIAGNFFGTDDSGTQANVARNHITVQSANNIIGGTHPSARNIILGGVQLTGNEANSNVIQGNYFGTDITGTVKLGPGSVFITDGSNNLIGGTTPGARNIIVSQIWISNSGATGNIVQGNYVGTDVTGTIAFGGTSGVTISSASNNTIGGKTPETRNIIAGGSGMRIVGTGNIVQGNYIGTDVTGTVALSNTRGIELIGNGNLIGGSALGAGNLISGNTYDGIIIQDGYENVVQGNLIGTDVTGTVALPNGLESSFGDGIEIWGPRNIIGGSVPGAGNIIAASGGSGIFLSSGDASGNVIQGNYIGTDPSGTIMLGNGNSGIRLSEGINHIPTNNNIIGGQDLGEANTIAFNNYAGVYIASGTGNAVLSNSIISNGDLGIRISNNFGNDPGDADTGVNNKQNYPVLESVIASSGSTAIVGTLNSVPFHDFIVELFANTECDPSGFGEGETFLDTLTVTTNNAGDASFQIVLPIELPLGHSITATATDIDGNTSEFSQCVSVVPPNQVPVANNDSYSTQEDRALTISAPGVLSNDNDPEGEPLTTILSQTTSNGTLTLNNSGSFTYIPNSNFNGTDSFTYRASDGVQQSNIATVTITVTPVNDIPMAQDDTYTTLEGDTLTVTAVNGVLANDNDIDGNELSATISTVPEHGTLTLNNDGSFTYITDPTFNGQESFTYLASDGISDDIATVILTITPVNDAPLAVNDSYSVDQRHTLEVSAAEGVLANDSDEDRDSLTAVLVTNPSQAVLTLNQDGSFTYEPGGNLFVGTDVFTYKSFDGSLESNVATVSVIVNPNVAPVAVDDSYIVNEDSTLDVTAQTGVLVNDTDENNDTLTVILVSETSSGTLSVNSDGSFTYTPDANFNGFDSFAYLVNDSLEDSLDTATVNIQVNPVNDAPLALADGPVAVIVGQPVLFDASASDDIDNDPLIYSWDLGDGTVLNTQNSSIAYTYESAGIFTVSLIVFDGQEYSETFSTVANIGATGGGQRSDVDEFLAYSQPVMKSNELPAGTINYDVTIIYGDTIDANTFQVELNGQPFGDFNPGAGTFETVNIPLSPGRNVLLLTTDGVRSDGHTATDRDRLTFIVP